MAGCDRQTPIIHILVIGFHHKKGCQLEFSHPPLVSDDAPHECPAGWKYLPTLALPDGAHNFNADSIFFNLPSLVDPHESVYGVSCYRQIDAVTLKNRPADVTRSTVQKAVCTLARHPVYGYVEVKLSLIAHAFFEQGDFSRTDILVRAFDQLNACLGADVSPTPSPARLHVGIPLRDIVLRWRHKLLILFKLMLLQRRVICFGSPVRPICSLILAVASLHPALLESGWHQVACVRTSRPMSPMPDFPGGGDEAREAIDDETDDKHGTNTDPAEEAQERVHTPIVAVGGGVASLTREASIETLPTLLPLSAVSPSVWSAPIPIFAGGHLCLPYLSLPYMDLLSDASVHGYTIGTSNILFQQKRALADVLVDVEAVAIDAGDVELRRQLLLTTEDLRFMDFVVRHVHAPKEGAEGSESWVRAQFAAYAVALARTALVAGGAGTEHFNGAYVTAWKRTSAFEAWRLVALAENAAALDTLPPGHPFAGTMSVADMKLRIAQTESGRKLNQAVNHTSRAVGGAFSHARGALTSWWSSMTTTGTPVTAVPPDVPSAATAAVATIAATPDTIDEAQEQEDGIITV